MLTKLHNQHGRNKNYLKPKSEMNMSFGLNHFAGVVFYDAKGFLEKNRDTFSADLMHIIQSSKSKFLTNLFKEDFSMVNNYINVYYLIDYSYLWGIDES